MNNRAQRPGDTSIRNDGNVIPRAFNGRLRFEPGGALEGLVVGANYYWGHIKGSNQSYGGSDLNAGSLIGLPGFINVPGTLQVAIPNYQETIIGGHIAYLENNVHFIAEYARIDHTRDNGEVNRSEGGFVEVGYAFGDFTPFFLVDRLSLSHGAGRAAIPAGVVPQLPNGAPAILPENDFNDPYYTTSVVAQIFGSNWRYTGGVRWQPVDGLAVKATVGKWIGDGGSSVWAGFAQAAVAF